MIINNVEVYKISSQAEQTYRNNAKRDFNIDINVLRKKLTALLLNAQETNHIYDNLYSYRFGTFIVNVDESIKTIINVEWNNDTHYTEVPTKNKQGLIDTFLKLGLNENGNTSVRFKNGQIKVG